MQHPEVYFDAHTAICRRGQFDPDRYGFEDANVAQQTNANQANNTTNTANTTGQAAATGANQTANPLEQVTTTSVSQNWFELGLHLSNRSSEYFLVVDKVIFVMSAQWGSEILNGRKEISSSYCGTDHLYIVPPGHRMRYEPDVKNHINNLTLFVDGVPVPSGPPTSQLPGQGPGQGQGIGGNAQQQQGGLQQNQGLNNAARQDEFFLDSLPSYRVQMVLQGYFLDRKRRYVANFKKELVFYTASRFLE